MFSATPKQIGKLRRYDPLGMAFIEMSIVQEWEEQKKINDEQRRLANRARKH